MPSMNEVQNMLAKKSLYHFIQQLWPAVETKFFVSGWHIDAMCDHLEAVTHGQIKRLIINIPPRHMKSLTVSVFWPMWHWLQDPSCQWLYSSYASALSIRDNVKCRRIFQSERYQDLIYVYQRGLSLVDDQNTKIRFENNRNGYRLATSVDGALTGEGGDILVVDDPHNIIDSESEVKRRTTILWWDEAMSTRLNDPKLGAKVVMMQRSHENDLTGHILKNERGWDHLCLPARSEGKNRVVSSIGFVDPRDTIDQTLHDERYGDKELAQLESEMSEYAVAGQLQQRPSPRSGGMFPIDQFLDRSRIMKHLSKDRIESVVRYWDKAGTEGGGKRTAGVKVAKLKDGRTVIVDSVKGQWSAGKRELRMKATAHFDGVGCTIWTEQEPGSGGKESAENTVINLSGFIVKTDKVTGSKEVRAEPLATQVEHGNVWLLEGEWNKEFIEEMEKFPKGNFIDQVDAAAGGFNKLHVGNKQGGTFRTAMVTSMGKR